MNIQKLAIIIGAAVVASAANAQFGAASREDFSNGNGKTNSYGTLLPFISGDGRGTLFNYEKLLNNNDRFGLNFWSFSGGNDLGAYYRKTFTDTVDLQFGLVRRSFDLGPFGSLNSTDISVLGFVNLLKPDATAYQNFTVEGFAGFYRNDRGDSTDFQFGAKAAYGLQNGLSVDATFYSRRSDSIFAFGIGYRF